MGGCPGVAWGVGLGVCPEGGSPACRTGEHMGEITRTGARCYKCISKSSSWILFTKIYKRWILGYYILIDKRYHNKPNIGRLEFAKKMGVASFSC